MGVGGVASKREQLMDACSHGHLDIVKDLIKNGVPIYEDAICCASRNNQLDIIKYLIEQHNVPITKIAIGWATYNGRIDILKYLLEIGTPFYIKQVITVSHIKWAAFLGHMDIVKCLVEYGAPIDKEAIDSAEDMLHFDIVDYLFFNA